MSKAGTEQDEIDAEWVRVARDAVRAEGGGVFTRDGLQELAEAIRLFADEHACEMEMGQRHHEYVVAKRSVEKLLGVALP